MSANRKHHRLNRQQRESDLTQARVKSILSKLPNAEFANALSTLRREAGAPPLSPRTPAVENPYRLAPLMQDEYRRDRELQDDAPMASRGDLPLPTVTLPTAESLAGIRRTAVWVTLGSTMMILLAIALAVALRWWP